MPCGDAVMTYEFRGFLFLMCNLLMVLFSLFDLKLNDILNMLQIFEAVLSC